MKRFNKILQLRRHTKLKRFSRSATSVVLAVCLLISCMTVGLIATDAAKVTGEKVGASSTYTVYFRNNGSWSNVYVLTGSNLNMSGSDGAYENLYGSNINTFTAMSLVPGETKVYKASVTVYDNKIAFASANSTQSGYYASSGQICCVGNMASGKVVNMWTDEWTSRNGAAYKKYNLEDYTPPTPNITGINGDWSTGDAMTHDSGNNYYYAFNGDSNDKYFRFKFNSKYYEAYDNNFNLETDGTYKPYDGSTDNKKYGTRESNGNAFKLTANSSYSYRIYFDISGKKTWFTKTERTHSVSIKQQLGSGSATNVSTSTIGNVTGVNVTANASVTSGGNSYTFDHWAISGGTVSVCATQSGTYTTKTSGSTYATRNMYVKTASDSAVLTAVYTLNLPALSAPTNVKLNNAESDCTVTATTEGAKINLTWDTVINAGSYKVYKGTSLVATVTTNSYGIERAASSNGEYTVVAVPSDATQYNESTNSTGYTLTVNKQKLNQPTVAVSSTDIKNGDSIQLTVTDTNTSYTAAQYDYYYYTGSTPTISSTYKLTAGTPKTLSPTSNTTYKVIAYPKNGTDNDYYTQSDAKSADEVKVYSAPYKIAGSLVDTEWSYSAGIAFTNYIGEGVFYYQTSSLSSGTYHFSLYDSSENQYSGDNNNTNCVITLGEENQYTLTKNTNHKSFEVTGSGVFFVYYDTVNNIIWVTQNTWTITPHVYYKTFNLQTDSYNTAQSGTTGGTIDPDSETLVTKTTSTTLAATAASGYTFDGWYNNSDFAAGHKVYANASYTFTPNASGDYYALFKQNEPAHYNLNVASVDNVTVTATYNGTTIQEGGATLRVPVGASVSYTITLETGCQLDSTTPSGLTTGTHTFTMPAANTTITVNASKINYTITGQISPNSGTLKFYSDSAHTNEITTAQYGDRIYAQYTLSDNAYALDKITGTGNGSSRSAHDPSAGTATFNMGYANMTITATLKAATPTFTGTWPTEMDAYVNESFTITPGTVSPTGTTLKYKLGNGSYQSSAAFTAPSTVGDVTVTVQASNKPSGISTAATATRTVTVHVKYHEQRVTYYVDMHDNTISGNVQLAVVTNSSGNTIKTDTDGNPCSANMTQQGTSKVYAASVNTPLEKDGNGNYTTLYYKITFNGNLYVEQLNVNQINTLVNNPTKEIWLEAVNESSQPLKLTYSSDTTFASGSTPAVASGYRRIYLAKPYDWQTSQTAWKNIGVYHWGNYTDIGWTNGVHMNYLGYDSTAAGGYHYYYVDLPKTINGNKVNNIIFQGWGDNTTNGNNPSAQTGNIEDIADTANYFILGNESSTKFYATKGDDVTLPGFGRHVSTVVMNKNDGSVSIASAYTGASVTYASSDTSKVTVDADGVITPVASTINSSHVDVPVTITVTVKGTIGNKLTAGTQNGADTARYTISVSVHDPSKFLGFNPMSLESQNYTVNVPTVNSDQPGYFESLSVAVTGLQGATVSDDSAIILSENTTTVPNIGSKTISYTVKYAKSSSIFNAAYNDIELVGTAVSKSIRREGGARYGLKEWKLDNNADPDPAYRMVKTITDGVELVTTEGIAMSGDSATYNAVFESYNYVDITFTFNYYEYKPKKVDAEGNVVADNADGMIQYPYDATWAGNEDTANASFAASHTTKTCTVVHYEVRNKTADTVQSSDLVTAAARAIGVMPENNYYSYSIAVGNISVSNRQADSYTADATVALSQSVRHYSVYLNGDLVNNNFTYQQYAEPSVVNASKWYGMNNATESNPTDADYPLLATGKSYKFRVKGDTHLRTVEGDVDDDHFNRSEVGFSHYELTHIGTLPTNMKEYLLQNFYIADFFSPAKVLDPNTDNGHGGHLPYDDATFVGGGVVYYSMNGVTENNPGTPFENAVSAGYVDGNGTANATAVKEMLKANIEAQLDTDKVAGTVGDEEAMKIAYGTEITAKKNVEGGFNTGIIYRYLPLNQYNRNGSGNLIPDSEGKYTYNVNSNTFRYSNSLQSYQYVYASGNENKATNSGKNMRLYSYYIYSYVAYNQETNVPETRYEVVLSDNYADASTYWEGNPNPNPNS